MAGLEGRLRPNTDEVASSVVDGQAIIINLSNGMYYSVDGAGGVAWELIERGGQLAQIGDEIARRFGVERERVERDLQAFVGKLTEENLVRPVSAATSPDHVPATEASTGESPEAYQPPELVVYSDMGDLLALDPPMPGIKDLPWSDPSDENAG